ncbi:MAG: response regulator [Bryobacteraceae bacterium]|jgi:DNA-binding response OmpR family regulator
MKTHKPQILLVEDNPADANLVEEAIAEAQLECGLSIVRDGLAALEFIDRLDADPDHPRPDIVLLDLNLPKIGGEEVLRRVRANAWCGTAKVLIVSSSDAPADRERAMLLGASDYFRKPSNLDQFMELGPRIRAVLEGEPPNPASEQPGGAPR